MKKNYTPTGYGNGGLIMYKTVVKVDGMMCGMCESHVNEAVRKAR